MSAPASGDSSAQRPMVALSLTGLVAVLGGVVLLVVALFVLSANQSPAVSRYPVLHNAEGYGKLTSFTTNDLIFYLNCVQSGSGSAVLRPGFYQVPSSQMHFRVEERSGRHGQTTLTSVPEILFLRRASGHNWYGAVYVFAHHHEISNSPHGFRCATTTTTSLR